MIIPLRLAESAEVIEIMSKKTVNSALIKYFINNNNIRKITKFLNIETFLVNGKIKYILNWVTVILF